MPRAVYRKSFLSAAVWVLALVAGSCSWGTANPELSGKGLFSKPIVPKDGMRFGKGGELVFELFRGGTFVIDGASSFAWQRSDSYGDSAIIRSARPLGKRYRVAVEVGEIDYGLENLKGVGQDPDYSEGPLNENGCYLLAITDEAPAGHYINEWWHKHRKLVIDVDNNTYGSGMPNPIFMVYFDKGNSLTAFNGYTQKWTKSWDKAVEYKRNAWYRAEVEKTDTEYVLSLYDGRGNLLQKARVNKDKVWHADSHPDYFVVGDPHENYYQGSLKIRAIEFERDPLQR